MSEREDEPRVVVVAATESDRARIREELRQIGEKRVDVLLPSEVEEASSATTSASSLSMDDPLIWTMDRFTNATTQITLPAELYDITNKPRNRAERRKAKREKKRRRKASRRKGQK